MTLAKIIRNIKRGDKLIITPRVENWLATHGDDLGVRNDEDRARVVELLGASASNNADRSGRFGGSGRGQCLRRQVFAYQGMPVARIREPGLQNIFNDGTFRHIRWQMMGLAAGVFTDVEVRVVIPDWRLGVSIDAINDQEMWLFELKGTRRMPLTVEDISPEHMLQTHTYLFATGWDLCIYVAEDKASQNWCELIIRKDSTYIGMVESELTTLNNYIDRKKLPPVQAECRKKQGEYKQCPYATWCLQTDAEGNEWSDDGRWPWQEPHNISTGIQVGRRNGHRKSPSRTDGDD